MTTIAMVNLIWCQSQYRINAIDIKKGSFRTQRVPGVPYNKQGRTRLEMLMLVDQRLSWVHQRC